MSESSPPPLAPGPHGAPILPPARKPFAVQAAQFACWAPVTGLILGIVLNSTLNNPSHPASANDTRTVGLVLFCTNVLLNLSAFVMAIIALIGMRKHGTKGILVRALSGLAESIAIITFIVLFFWVNTSFPDRIAARLVGQWHAKMHVNSETYDLFLQLTGNKRGTMTLVKNDVGKETPMRSAAGTGQWHVEGTTPAKPPHLVLHLDAGHDPSLSDGYDWVIENITEIQVGLNSDSSGDPYTRLVFKRESN